MNVETSSNYQAKEVKSLLTIYNTLHLTVRWQLYYFTQNVSMWATKMTTNLKQSEEREELSALKFFTLCSLSSKAKCTSVFSAAEEKLPEQPKPKPSTGMTTIQCAMTAGGLQTTRPLRELTVRH